MKQSEPFSRYQIGLIVIIALIQFSVVVDFMVLSPLGTFVMKDLVLQPNEFSLVVSGYAFSAFISAIATAGFADRFDRKRMLLFFFSGFILGTLFCALSNSYITLLLARVITGLFGGVISSISYAIITDLFAVNQRGRVMGFVQMAFGVSQIVGIPLGLYLTSLADWHLPFYVIVSFALALILGILTFMKPVKDHLSNRDPNYRALDHFVHIFKTKRYLNGFLATALLTTGGYMLMPFGSDFAVQNLKLTAEQLPFMYMATGIFTFVTGPLAGVLSDKFGRYSLFVSGTIISIIIVLIYTRLGESSLWPIIALNVILFVGITFRIVPAQAMMTQIPASADRGAFMSINSAVQQLSGGIASTIAGMIVYKSADGTIQNYPILGMVVATTMIIAMLLMGRVHRMLKAG
jgi:predicted MFS family arabinose efflux permease